MLKRARVIRLAIGKPGENLERVVAVALRVTVKTPKIRKDGQLR